MDLVLDLPLMLDVGIEAPVSEVGEVPVDVVPLQVWLKVSTAVVAVDAVSLEGLLEKFAVVVTAISVATEVVSGDVRVVSLQV